MQKKFMRRSVAAVASVGLVLVALPLASPANAQTEACALGATCEGSLPGSLGASPYKIVMPEKFNGTVMLYSHGYRFANPIPAAFAGPALFDLIGKPNYTAVQVPGLAAAGLGTDTAFVGNNAAEVVPGDSPTIAANLLAQGYALAGTGYAAQGWAVAEGVEAGENMIRLINSGAVKGTKRIVTWGSSMGANVATAIAERNPKKVAGVLPMCSAFAGPEELLGNGMTALFTWKSLVTPNLTVANYAAGPAGYVQAVRDLATVLGVVQNLSTAPVSPTGYPYAQANLLGGLMAGFPTKGNVYDGETLNPIVGVLAQNPQIGATAAPAVASAQGFSPVTAGASSAAAMVENVTGAAALGIFVRLDLEQRARKALNLAPSDNVNFNDNVGVRYSQLLSAEQRGEFGDVLNQFPGFPGLLNSMLDKLDSSVGNSDVRYPANPAVVKWIRGLSPLSGKYNQPTVLMTTTYDTVTPAGNQGMYTDKLQASFKKQGKKAGLNKIVSLYTIPPEDGYTKFAPGGRAPDSDASKAANVSGVGHCQFEKIGGGVQIVNSVAVLNRLMNAKTQKQVAAAKRIGFNTAGVNIDREFTPDALKRPLATVAR